jgi:hypothetical protein
MEYRPPVEYEQRYHQAVTSAEMATVKSLRQFQDGSWRSEAKPHWFTKQP